MIKATFKISDIKAFVEQSIINSQTAYINVLKFVGEGFIRDARINGNYEDRTGNLRSSIGYVILQDGKQIDLNFQLADRGTDKVTGIDQGKLFAEQVVLEYPKGIVLICVAGMDYAYYVETKGFDVITGSTIELETRLKALLEQL